MSMICECLEHSLSIYYALAVVNAEYGSSCKMYLGIRSFTINDEKRIYNLFHFTEYKCWSYILEY